MCGRTGLSLNKDQVRCACSYRNKNENVFVKPEWVHEHNDGKDYIPSYNIAPTDITPVLISSSNYRSPGNRIIKPMMWGMIPSWHKGDHRKHNLSTNNCRIENIKQSKLYNPVLMNGGRCVIVVEGFYEWQTTVKSKVKQPYYIYAPQDEHIKIDDSTTFNNSYDSINGWSGVKLLYIAGLYNIWQCDGKIIYSYSIITMESNSTLSWLHHRMPAILDTETQIEAWLDIENVNPDLALSYLKPSKVLSWHPVSTAVNNSKYKSDDCNKRISTEKKKSSQTAITSWYAKVEKRKSNDNENIQNKKPKNLN